MSRRGESLPPSKTNASADNPQETKKKSFVRVSRAKNAQARGKARSNAQKVVEPEVLEAEIVDEDPSESRGIETLDADPVEGDWIDAEQAGGAVARYEGQVVEDDTCLLYTSPSPLDRTRSRMPSSA